MDGMSVKQSIEIETKNHTTLMMGGARQQDNSKSASTTR